ncbi:hypothetical protein CKM354_000609500 [Cercospora kikuchii]|uniref:Uncharacterized protein n=1 Tax=Cercospora kikuchii TaxID=84275 RepID=A0A9P3FG60_9PEZI|nr:uncharacterized protein CKM354_000609500 [Cercospora kikuchii]GIZ42842.1 hypothetical protein CKM354_000609500 [Cercospora kikuchii]
MLFSNSVCALVAVLTAQALANKDSTTCYTEMTYKSPGRQPVTNWVTHKTPCTVKQTHTETKTKTPTYTKVETKYTTTYITDRNKDTSTKIVTETKDTKTVTDTTTDTFTTTTTTSVTSTSSVPARADFTAIQQSVPGATNGGDVGGPPAGSPNDLDKRSGYGNPKKSYPKKVTCHKYTKDGKCATRKVTTTKTIHAKPKTVYSKTTKTKTETKCPGAKKTITSTVYDTKTTTITTSASTTTTSTATSIVASTTVYGECLLPSNYADRVNGSPIIEIEAMRVALAQEEVSGIEDAFSCCNAAFSPRAASEGAVLESVETWFFDRASTEENPDVFTSRCVLLGSSNMCNARQADGPWTINTIAGEPIAYGVVGNARCGQAVFGEELPPFEEGEGGTLRASSAGSRQIEVNIESS